jgi:hypothetical protein
VPCYYPAKPWLRFESVIQLKTWRNIMKKIISDRKLVAYCGLYCGACKTYLKGRCPGCHDNKKGSWCKIRTCCAENSYASCSECKEFMDPMECYKFNNFISKIFAFVFRSNRAACIQQIRDIGIQGHADKMTDLGVMTLKR